MLLCLKEKTLSMAASLRQGVRGPLRSLRPPSLLRPLVDCGPQLDAVWLRNGRQFSVPALRPDCPPLLRVDLDAADATGHQPVVGLWVCGHRPSHFAAADRGFLATQPSALSSGRRFIATKA